MPRRSGYFHVVLTLVYRESKTNRLLELQAEALLFRGGCKLESFHSWDWFPFADRDSVGAARWALSDWPSAEGLIEPVNAFLGDSEPVIVRAESADGNWQEWEAEIDVGLPFDANMKRLLLTRDGAKPTFFHCHSDDRWYSTETKLRYDHVLIASRAFLDDRAKGYLSLPAMSADGPRLRLSPLA